MNIFKKLFSSAVDFLFHDSEIVIFFILIMMMSIFSYLGCYTGTKTGMIDGYIEIMKIAESHIAATTVKESNIELPST